MMDGMIHPGPTPVFDILYAEDFGAPDEAPAPPPPEPVAQPAEPSLTHADLEAASAAAVRRARDAWEQSAVHERTQALGTLAAEIAAARQEARQVAEATAEGLAQAALSLLAGALPSLCAAHGDTEVRALLQRFLPTLQMEQRVTIRVRPSLVADVEQDVALLDEELAAKVGVLPGPLAAGDVRVSWTDGSLVRDSGAICAAMQDVLAQLGLLSPTPIPNRRLAHAD